MPAGIYHYFRPKGGGNIFREDHLLRQQPGKRITVELVEPGINSVSDQEGLYHFRKVESRRLYTADQPAQSRRDPPQRYC